MQIGSCITTTRRSPHVMLWRLKLQLDWISEFGMFPAPIHFQFMIRQYFRNPRFRTGYPTESSRWGTWDINLYPMSSCPIRSLVAELTSSEKLFNYQLAHVRVAIENIFKRVKDYRIISEIYRRDYHQLEQFNCIFKVVCELVNIYTQTHPVRRQLSSMRKLPMVLQPHD